MNKGTCLKWGNWNAPYFYQVRISATGTPEVFNKKNIFKSIHKQLSYLTDAKGRLGPLAVDFQKFKFVGSMVWAERR